MPARHVGRGLVGAGAAGALAVLTVTPFADSAAAIGKTADTTSNHGTGHDATGGKSTTASAKKPLAADYGNQKFRVGVQQKDGSYVPAGSSTNGSELTITESGPYVQQQLGKPSVTYTCTTSEPDETDPVTYPTGTFCNSSVDPLNPSDARRAHADLTTGPTPGFPFGDQEFTAGPGDTVTVTQTTVEPNYVIDSSTATLRPCKVQGTESNYCGSETPTTGPDRSTDLVFDDGGLPPTADPDSATTQDPNPVDIDVLANDDTHGAPLTGLSVTSDPSHGTATVESNDQPTAKLRRAAVTSSQYIRYTPDTGFSGVDHFKYTITDANGTATALVTVHVTPPPPLAVDDTATTKVGTPVTIDVLANDHSNGGGHITITSVGTPSHGSAVVKGNDVVYTPRGDYHGTDSFPYTISTKGGTSTAKVTVTIDIDPPKAVDDHATTELRQPVTVNVLANDHSNGGGPITITSVGDPKHGSARIDGDQVIYTPRGDYHGTDSFPYTIRTRGGTSSATVFVTIGVKPPLAVDDHASTSPGKAVTIDVLGNDHAYGEGPITITSVGDPKHGTARVHDGTVVYTPHADYTGTDTFVYSIRTIGGTSRATVTVSIVGSLSITGTDSAQLLGVAAALLIAGGAATVVGRRRYRAAHVKGHGSV